ncbi:MAG: helix-turn-helix transcriptional regulator [Nanoarchaeota archaeon]|nr:helix-turn-helix transcriptional regulator [Nanoarchaeota archaeon]
MYTNYFHGIEPRIFGLKYIVLSLLVKNKLSGAEMMDRIEKMSLGFFHPSPGSIYPLLKYLTKKGLIKAEEKDGKKVYSLSDKGRELIESAFPSMSLFKGFGLFNGETNSTDEAFETIENYVDFLSETKLSKKDLQKIDELIKRLQKLRKK